MKYTIDGPEMGFEAFIEGERQIVATLVHLPEASAKTAAMFGRHAARSWLDQPEYASFSEDNNSRVVRWDGSTLDIKTKKELRQSLLKVLNNDSSDFSEPFINFQKFVPTSYDSSIKLVNKYLL